MKYTKLQIGIIVFGITVAIVLRLLFLGDMEWKWDEKWMWIHSLDWSHRNVLPEVGKSPIVGTELFSVTGIP
jgi:hypothetical protein